MTKLSHLSVPVSWVPLGLRGLLLCPGAISGGKGLWHRSSLTGTLLPGLRPVWNTTLLRLLSFIFFYLRVPRRASIRGWKRGELYLIWGSLMFGREETTSISLFTSKVCWKGFCLIWKSEEGNKT